MPIGRFLCVVTPLLVAFLWLLASSMEPASTARPTSAQARAASPATTVGRASEPGSVRSSASPTAEPSAVSPQPAVQDTHLTNAENALARTEASASTGLASTQQKQASRKRQVQPQRTKTQASTQHPGYQVQTYHSAYSNARNPAYSGYRPFF